MSDVDGQWKIQLPLNMSVHPMKCQRHISIGKLVKPNNLLGQLFRSLKGQRADTSRDEIIVQHDSLNPQHTLLLMLDKSQGRVINIGSSWKDQVIQQ